MEAVEAVEAVGGSALCTAPPGRQYCLSRRGAVSSPMRAGFVLLFFEQSSRGGDGGGGTDARFALHPAGNIVLVPAALFLPRRAGVLFYYFLSNLRVAAMEAVEAVEAVDGSALCAALSWQCCLSRRGAVSFPTRAGFVLLFFEQFSRSGDFLQNFLRFQRFFCGERQWRRGAVARFVPL